MNSYNLSRNWFNFSFENIEKVKPLHTAIYFFAIDTCNRLGWKKNFSFRADKAMEATGIKSPKVYKPALLNLVEWGFIELIQDSKNQYTACIIALVKNTEATDKADKNALDKALTQSSLDHLPNQGTSTCQDKGNIYINKETIKQINKETINLIEKFPNEFINFINNNKNLIFPEFKKNLDIHEEIKNLYNKTCTDLPKVEVLTPERIEAINLILKMYSKEKIKIVFENARDSKYLNGQTENTWSANFNWLLKPDNFLKVLENQYRNNTNNNNSKFGKNR